MMRRFGLTLGIGFTVMAAALTADATIVALYDFPTDQGTTLPSASTDSDPFSTASGLNLGAGLPLSGTNSSGISSIAGNPVNSLFMRNVNNSTEAFAVSGNKYFTFSVTPTAALNFTSLGFDYFLTDADSAEFFALRTNAGGDNFTTTISSGTLTSPFGTWQTFAPLDLSSVAGLQDTTSAVTFRFYVWGAAENTDLTRFDNITLNATAVPEPEAYGMLACGVALLAAFRRLRKALS